MSRPGRTLLGSVTGLAHTRLALLGVELREELGRFAWLVIGAGSAVALAALTIAAASVAIVLAAAPEYRTAAAALLALIFATACALAIWRVHAMLAVKPTPFELSLGELQVDRQALLAESTEQRAALGASAGALMRLVSIGVFAYSIARRLRRAA